MNDKVPPEVVVSPPDDDIKSSPPKSNPKITKLRPYLPFLVITLSLPVIFLASRNPQSFFGRASSPCGNSYPCPTPCSNSYPCPPPPCTNTYDCPSPTTIVKNAPPVITTKALPVGRSGQRYAAVVSGIDRDTKEALAMTISNLPTGLSVGRCLTKAPGREEISRIVCPIYGTPAGPGTNIVWVTLRDRPGSPESITVSKDFDLKIIGLPIPKFNSSP